MFHWWQLIMNFTPRSFPVGTNVSTSHLQSLIAVPADLESHFELGAQSPRSVTVEVDPVSPELVEPHTAGFLEVRNCKI